MGKRGVRVTTRFHVTFTPELGGELVKYADQHNMAPVEAIRELVQIGLAASPNDAAILASKQRAYMSVRAYCGKRAADMLAEIAADVDRTFSDPGIFRG